MILVWAILFVQGSSFATPEFESSVTPEVKQLILGDLDFLSQIQMTGETAMHLTVFGGYGGSVYSRWLDQRIQKYGGMTERVEMASFHPGSPAELWITLDYIGNVPSMGRISIYMHEARHSEGGYAAMYPHVQCPRDFKDKSGNEIQGRFTGVKIAGRDGCDDVKFGAYGIQLLMMKNIAKFCTKETCTQVQKDQAALYADDYLARIADTRGKSFSAHAELANDLDMETRE